MVHFHILSFELTDYEHLHRIAYQTLNNLLKQTRCSHDLAHRWLEEYYNQKMQSKQKPSRHIISNGDVFHTRIYTKLKEIMLEVDLDGVTTKFVSFINCFHQISNCNVRS